MDNEIARKWINALRNSSYKQSSNNYLRSLIDDEICYTSMGVLCDVYSKELKVKWESSDFKYFTIHGKHLYFPLEVRVWAGILDKYHDIYVKYRNKHISTFALEKYHGLNLISISNVIENFYFDTNLDIKEVEEIDPNLL